MAKDFPKTIEAFHTKNIGGGAYGSPVDGMTPPVDYAFYADGHPYVESMQVATYELVRVRDVVVDRSQDRIATWDKRNGRSQ
jgi:hypothetical protein